MKFVYKFLEKKANKIKVRIAFIVTYCIIISIHLFSFFLNQHLDVIQLTIQLLFLMIIHIWIHSTPIYYKRIRNLKHSFNKKSYRKLYDTYVLRMHPFPWHSSINSKKRKSRKRKSRKRKSKKRRVQKIVQFLYLIIWFSIFLFLSYQSINVQLLPANVITILTILLFFIAMSLNYYSYYSCITFTLFLRKLSHLSRLTSFRYNHYIPSLTSSFQQLLSHITFTSLTFFIVSFLFTTIYSIAVLNRIYSNDTLELLKYYPLFFYIATCITCILGFGTLFVLYLMPRFYLKRIHNLWKETSLLNFEKKLYSAERQNNSAEIDRCVNIISRISQDKLSTHFQFLNLTIAFATCLTDFINMLVIFTG